MSDQGHVTISTWEPPVGALGIDSVELAHDGAVTARMRDGSKVPVLLPTGWQVQCLGAAIVYRCPCGALVLGAPVHEHAVTKCPECNDGGPPDDNEQCFVCGEPKARPRAAEPAR